MRASAINLSGLGGTAPGIRYLEPLTGHILRMRAPKTSITATAGASEVQGLLERLGWGVVPVPEQHDLGTDLLAAVRDSRRFDTGLLIGVQVKSGPSFFDQPRCNHAGAIDGWWYYQEDTSHFDYWIKHQAPHLLVLYNLDSRKGYWVHVTAEQCVPTGKGIKILVPAHQLLEPSQSEPLIAVAATKRASISLEGTAFDAATYKIAPGDRLRHALLLPRLIAPHQNRGIVANIEPEEALAILALYRGDQFQSLMEDHASWPDLRALPVSGDWRWQFVHAVWNLLTTGDTGALSAVLQASKRSDWTVCAVAVLAAARYDRRDVRSALELVRGTIARDVAAPIDQSWLHLHESRYALELGDFLSAMAAADRAIAALATSGDDASASFLRGLAYRNKLSMGDFAEASFDLGKTISAGDNAGAWWRSQQMLWASEAAHAELFRDWSGDELLRWESHSALTQLTGGIFASGLAADQPAWQGAQLRLGRFSMMKASSTPDVANALLKIGLSGDAEVFRLAAGRLVMHGPCLALAMVANALEPSRVLHSQISVFLRYWESYGQFAPIASADEFAHAALAALFSDPSTPQLPWYEARNRSLLLDALSGAMPAVSHDAAAQIAARIPDLKDVKHIEADAVGRLVARLVDLRPDSMAPEAIVALAGLYPAAPGLTWALGVQASDGHAGAKELLLARIPEGGRHDWDTALRVDLLEPAHLSNLGASLREQLERFRQSAKGVSGGDRGTVAGLLASIALKTNEPADWTAVSGFIGDPAVTADDKVEAVARVARGLASVPEEGILTTFRKQLPGLAASRYRPRDSELNGERDPATDLAALLGHALAVPDDERDKQLEALLLHPATTLRRRALRALSFRVDDFVELAALRALGDEHPGVRATAAGLVGRLIGAGRWSEGLELAASHVASDSGEWIPECFVGALGSSVPRALDQVIGTLKKHPSARVRRAAASVIAQDADGAAKSVAGND